MDDLYYWVLCVWRVLTSKRVLAGVTIAVAVVVTVTTVFAAPLSPEEESVQPSGVASVVAPVVTSSEVPVEPLVEFVIGEVTDSGMLPSSPFYFLKEAARSVEYAFTFDPVKKANLTLRFANEDALAIRALCIDDEYLAAAQQCIRYQDDFFTSLAWAVKAKKEGCDVDAVMTNLRTAHHTHRLILADTLERLPEQFGEAAIGAVASTSAPFEQVIGWIQGPSEAVVFHTKLENDFSSVDQALWWSIESRLGLDPEQVVKLSEAMGVPSVVGGTPIITSLRPDSSQLAPGESHVLTCMASDMEHDVLSYQWLATDGELDDQGQSTVSWIAPDEEGVYTVTVVVSDDKGNQTSKDVRLVVGALEQAVDENRGGGAFSIDGFSVEPNGHSKLKLTFGTKDDYTIFTGREAIITCEVDGSTDGLEYEWSCVRLTSDPAHPGQYLEISGNGGNLSGSGDSVIWEAFEGGGYGRVTVVVRSGDGVEQTDSVDFRVSTCANCFG